MRRALPITALGAAALLAACGGPSIGEGDLGCGDAGLCPPDFHCSPVDNRCYRGAGPGVDGPAAPDAAGCGNGALDPGETCDPCRPSCNDGNPCTNDLATGAASTCDLVCTHPPTTICTAGDACCPAS